MQQRFCECGFSVWVQYVFLETECQPVFWATASYHHRNVSRCPSCGKRLNIDELN